MVMATSTPSPSRTSVPRDEFVPTGWATFAGIVLFVAAFFSSIWGLAAILNDEVVQVGGQGVMILDFTAWGWAQLIVGVVMTLTAFGLFAGHGWARRTAVFFAALSAIAQVGTFSAFPLWSLLIVALDVTVIYQLTARWVPVRR